MNRRHLKVLHQRIVGEAISDKEIEECLLAIAPRDDEKKVVENETKLVHKLKMHLIYQQKHNEAKKFMECHQKFKNSSLPKNRDFIIQFMYSLFDKRGTVAAMSAKKTITKVSGDVPASESEDSSLARRIRSSAISSNTDANSAAGNLRHSGHANIQSNIVTHRYGNITKEYQLHVEKVNKFTSGATANVNETQFERNRSPSQETGYSSLSKSPRELDSNVQSNTTAPKNRMSRLAAFPLEFDATPMPKLQYSQDTKMRNEIHRSEARIPPLDQSVAVTASLSSISSGDTDASLLQGHTGSKNGCMIPNQTDSSKKFIGFPKDYHSLVPSGNKNIRVVPSESHYNRHSRESPQQNPGHGFTSVGRMETSYPSENYRPVSAGRFLPNSKSVEKDLIKDLVYIFQGIDGTVMKCDSANKYHIQCRYPIHPSTTLQTLRLGELGALYKKIRNYCDKPITGLMVQGLKHAFEQELREFYRLLAVVQTEIQQKSVDTPMSEENQSRAGEDMTMLKLSVWVFDCLPRLEVLVSMIEACEDKKGGEMCSILYQYAQHGDPMVSKLSTSILTVVSKPIYIMLCQWILYGELEDPHNEFFIAADVTCKIEQLWHSKYHIRKKMLPSFITMKSAEKILATGKNINFLKEICHNSKGYEGRGQIKALLERSPVECLFLEEDRLLNTAIEKAYQTTSEMVLYVLIEDSRLLDHLKAIKHYLLLGQGDFIQHLLELIQNELSKPANKLYNHNLAAILDSAIRATNAQFEKEDIQNRLDTRILPTSDKDLGWDVFCLDYKVQGPIGTVLTEDVMIRYNQLFNTLWRTKRIETILSTLWKNQTTLFKYQRTIPELGPVLHRSQLLISEMIHFVHQTQYYIMFEATECAWDRLTEDVSKSTDLDQVIKAHNKFLHTITSRSLLDPESRELLNQLRGIFDSVHELKKFLSEFDERVTIEMQHRRHIKLNTSEQRGAQKEFFASYIMQAKGKIETLYTTTQDLVRSFLLVLNRQADLTLQCLSFRLDFNEYYHLKDSRLSQPLTFQHRRLSSNTFTPLLNMSTSATGLNLSNSLFTSMPIFETDNEI